MNKTTPHCKYLLREILSIGFYYLHYNNQLFIGCALHCNAEQDTLQMFTGVYRLIEEFFCKICRENPMITIELLYSSYDDLKNKEFTIVSLDQTFFL